MKIHNVVGLGLALSIVMFPAAAVEKISLQALFKDKAIMLVDGTRRVLATGDTSPEGVKLVATDTRDEKAEIEIGGKRQELKLGTIISSYVSTGKPNSIVLYPENGGHFFADGVINGSPVRFLVDTGATMIALSSVTANRIGIDYRKNGKAGYAGTAGGVVQTYYIKLDYVQVGDIKIYNVDAGVIEGAHPTDVLLGMSFLGRLDMKRDGEKMELIQRY